MIVTNSPDAFLIPRFIAPPSPFLKLFNNLNLTVVSIGSTMALEAALYGKVVGVLGDVHFKNSPGIFSLDSPKNWTSLLTKKSVSIIEIKKWYSNFIDNYCVEGNIMKNQTKIKNFDKFIRNVEKFNL